MAKMDKTNIILCGLPKGLEERILSYAEALVAAAPAIGDHGLSADDFRDSGIFESAIEKLRGRRSASTSEKSEFIEKVLERMRGHGRIAKFAFTGAGDRHDYEVTLSGNGRVSILEAKGCLDGQNTTVSMRPANADEFIIWSLCQNKGSDPKHNLWSGVHTRIGAEIIAEKKRVDALIVWDMLCGTKHRPCPKLPLGRGITEDGRQVPPPCIYLFPRTTPDPRNNAAPATWRIEEIGFAEALLQEFGGDVNDITYVHIETRMNGPSVERKTALKRNGEVVAESKWTKLKRAAR